jgi:hypothetical protein
LVPPPLPGLLGPGPAPPPSVIAPVQAAANRATPKRERFLRPGNIELLLWLGGRLPLATAQSAPLVGK